MRVYLDEDVASHELANRLAARHEVVPTRRGVPDRQAWEHAQDHSAVVITMNGRDFRPLADATAVHHGLVVVYREGNPKLDMTPAEMAAALDLAADRSGDLADKIVILNHYRS